MSREPRHSHVSLKVLKYLIDRPQAQVSGSEIGKALSIPSGSLYPILLRYEQAGWLTSEWEDVEPAEAGRPRRRLYRLGDLGNRRAIAIMEELGISLQGVPQWAPG